MPACEAGAGGRPSATCPPLLVFGQALACAEEEAGDGLSEGPAVRPRDKDPRTPAAKAPRRGGRRAGGVLAGREAGLVPIKQPLLTHVRNNAQEGSRGHVTAAGVGAAGPANPASHRALLRDGPGVAGSPPSIPSVLLLEQTCLFITRCPSPSEEKADLQPFRRGSLVRRRMNPSPGLGLPWLHDCRLEPPNEVIKSYSRFPPLFLAGPGNFPEEDGVQASFLLGGIMLGVRKR